MSRLQPGDTAPTFRSQAVKDGEIVDYTLDDAMRGNQYLLLVFYPADFTFVCPTEIVQFMEKSSDFAGQQCGIICCSVDSAFTHLAWLKAPKSERGLGAPDKSGIVLLSDRSHEISEAYGVLAPDNGASYRGTFLIGPDKRICHVTINDMPVGRSVEDSLRMVSEMRSQPPSSLTNSVGQRMGSRSTSANRCSRPHFPQEQQPLTPQQPPQPLQQRCFQQQQQQYQQQYQQQLQQQQQQQQYQQQQQCQQQPQQQCQQQYQHQQQPTCSGFTNESVSGLVYQCEPLSFSVGQPVCSGLAVEAASLETQAAQLRVKDSEDRLAWMLNETDRLRLEADRLRGDTERLKAEARRRQTEAERLMSCQNACQAAASGGMNGPVAGTGHCNQPTATGYGAVPPVDDCSWSTGVPPGHRGLIQHQQHHNQPATPPPQLQSAQPPPPMQQQQQQLHHYQHPAGCQAQSPQPPPPPVSAPPRRQQSHVCRRGSNSVTSHVGVGNGGHRMC